MSTGRLFQFYQSTAWKKARKIVLERDYLYKCNGCKKSGDIVVADVVHHVIPITPDNVDEYGIDLNNLIAINRQHNEILHGRYIEDEETDYYFDEDGQLESNKY